MQLRDNDTILVGPKRSAIEVDGAVTEHAKYEFSGKSLSGGELIKLARPSGATYAMVHGVRNGKKFNVELCFS